MTNIATLQFYLNEIRVEGIARCDLLPDSFFIEPHMVETLLLITSKRFLCIFMDET